MILLLFDVSIAARHEPAQAVQEFRDKRTTDPDTTVAAASYSRNICRV